MTSPQSLLAMPLELDLSDLHSNSSALCHDLKICILLLVPRAYPLLTNSSPQGLCNDETVLQHTGRRTFFALPTKLNIVKDGHVVPIFKARQIQDFGHPGFASDTYRNNLQKPPPKSHMSFCWSGRWVGQLSHLSYPSPSTPLLALPSG